MTDADRERAAQLKRWLENDPEMAVEILQAGLTMLAVHGYVRGNGERLVWTKTKDGA